MCFSQGQSFFFAAVGLVERIAPSRPRPGFADLLHARFLIAAFLFRNGHTRLAKGCKPVRRALSVGHGLLIGCVPTESSTFS